MEDYTVAAALRKQSRHCTGLLSYNAVPRRVPEENHLTMSLLSADMQKLAQGWGLSERNLLPTTTLSTKQLFPTQETRH